MNTDIEELLHDGMQRFTAGLGAPAGLAHAADTALHRRRAVRGMAAAGTAAVTAAAVIAVAAGASGTPARTGVTAQARTTAYVVKRVERALTAEHRVFVGHTTSTFGPSVTWSYGARNRFEETSHGRRYLDSGTAVVGGKLVSAYVTYFDRKYSLSPVSTPPTSACSTTARLEMGGPPPVTRHWSDFINATLACGTASVTGHVRINGQETTRITGTPVTITLSPRYARAIQEKQARVTWTLYVDPKTYLPVQMDSSTAAFGGPAAPTDDKYVTTMRWLPPTPANIAKATVTIPPGFRLVPSAADQ